MKMMEIPLVASSTSTLISKAKVIKSAGKAVVLLADFKQKHRGETSMDNKPAKRRGNLDGQKAVERGETSM